jgi:hypothetical protein
MDNFVLDLQAKASEEADRAPAARSDWTTVLCGHSWVSISC